MDKCREAFERHQADLTDTDYEVLKHHFDNNEQYFGSRYNEGSLYERDWFVWEACWQSRQAEVDQLQSQINEMAEVGLSQESAIREKDKRIEAALSELESLHNKKWAEWKEQADMHSQGEANAYEHAMQILEKALRGEHE